jgi:hypothetical protein
MLMRTGNLNPNTELVWEATRLESDLGGFKASIYKLDIGWGFQVERKTSGAREVVLTRNAETLKECMEAVERWGRASEDLGPSAEVPGEHPGSSV